MNKNSDIELTILDSYLFKNRRSKWITLFYSILSPITIYILTKNYIKQKTKQMKITPKQIALTIIVFITALTITSNYVNYYNQSVTIKGNFNENLSHRATIYDKMKKELKEELHIANINDSSYSKLVQMITDTRMDNSNLMWKWTMENNPNANYSEVSNMYKTVQNNIGLLRTELQSTENALQRNVKEWYILHSSFPSNIFLSFQNDTLEYKSILSSETSEVNITGVDETTNF